ncbi:MAG TPA: amidase [Myxococcota bacterium]|nr:amidase [Myxococcota bacterium]
MDEIARMDAVEQAARVRKGELSARELVEAAIARIERVDPELNAAVIRLHAEGRAAAAPASGPLGGVPFLLKDVGARQAGLPYTAGNRALREAGFRAREDSSVGARFREIGLVTLGKSNTPEFGLQSTTQPLAYGPTRNPWDPSRSSGGSSGGACAAVAAGLVPAAHASDGAGSIRIPAAWCGLVGLKPSRGRLAVDPRLIRPTSVEFAVGRSLRDTAALLDLLQGSRPGALWSLPPPHRPYAAELGAPVEPLRVGLCDSVPGASVHPECARAVALTGALLDSFGHRVEASCPEAIFASEERALLGLVFGPLEFRACLADLAEMLGRPVERDDVEPFLWELADWGAVPVSADQYLRAAELQQAWAARIAAWWAGGFDLLVTPTVPEPALPLEELDAVRLGTGPLLDRMGLHMVFTEPFNATGQPALTLPLHWTPEGLPVGVQLVAALGRDDLLMRVAAQLESARPWRERIPPIHA